MAGIAVQKDNTRLFVGPRGESLTEVNKMGNVASVGDVGGEIEEIDTTTIDSMAKEYEVGFEDNGTVEITQNLTSNEYSAMKNYKDNNEDLVWAISSFDKKGEQVIGLTGNGVISGLTLTGIGFGELLQVVTTIRVSGAINNDFVDPIGPVFGKKVTKITVSGMGGKSEITEPGGTLQLVATVEPADAANRSVTYSLKSGSDTYASVSASGLVTAKADGTATVIATAKDGSGVTGELAITISGQA